jgi:hypothetical protein
MPVALVFAINTNGGSTKGQETGLHSYCPFMSMSFLSLLLCLSIISTVDPVPLKSAVTEQAKFLPAVEIN